MRAGDVRQGNTGRKEMHGRVCEIANVVSNLCTVCGKHVGTSLIFDGEGGQLGGIFGFLSVGTSQQY